MPSSNIGGSVALCVLPNNFIASVLHLINLIFSEQAESEQQETPQT